MKISKITNIVPDGSFESAHGTLYAFTVTFDDGTIGNANAKAAKPPYSIGDMVGYDITGQDKRGNNKLKIDRKAAQQAGALPPQAQAQATPATTQPPSNPHAPLMINGQTVGMAINNAVEVLRSMGVDYGQIKDGEFAKAVHEIASQLIRVSHKLEQGKLAPPASRPVPAAVQQAQALAQTYGFTPVQPNPKPAADGVGVALSNTDEDVPF